MPTLREIAVEKSKRQPHQIDSVLCNCPILESMLFCESNHGLQHAYEELTKVTGGAFVPMDAPLPLTDAIATLKFQDLGILGFTLEAGVDKVTQLYGKNGFAKYLAKKVAKIITKTSMATEKALIYNSLLPIALKNKKALNAGATSNCYSLYAIRWVEDEFCGLYDPNGFGQGAIFDAIPLSNGAPYKNKNGITVYGTDFKSNLGFLFATADNVSAIVNIDDTHIPTAQMVDTMLENVHAGDVGKTYIFGHPHALNLLKTIKEAALSMSPSDKNYSRSIKQWDSIEMIGSYNFDKGTEAKVDITGDFNVQIGDDLKVYEEQYFTAAALPKNADVTSEFISTGEGGANGSISIKAIANTAITLADTKKVTFSVIDSDGTHESTLFTKELTTGAKKNTVLFEFVLPPQVQELTKVKIVSDDAAITGKVDIYPRRLPR
ncbi:MAG: major capsid protein [Pleomorphochaeta sp.]